MRAAELAVHVLAGALGILSGFVALSVSKGATSHRRSGLVFVYSMITMGLMGSAMAAARRVAPAANIPVGFLTTYLVITGLITVRSTPVRWRWTNIALTSVAIGTTLTFFAFGFAVLASPTGKLYGMPAFPFLIFGSIGLLAIVGDIRLIRSGGVQAIRGVPRLVRHLWRMNVALLIAAFSFFLGQAKVIPKPIRIFPVLVLPPLIVLAALLYWLWRIRFRRSLRGIVGVRMLETT